MATRSPNRCSAHARQSRKLPEYKATGRLHLSRRNEPYSARVWRPCSWARALTSNLQCRSCSKSLGCTIPMPYCTTSMDSTALPLRHGSDQRQTRGRQHIESNPCLNKSKAWNVRTKKPATPPQASTLQAAPSSTPIPSAKLQCTLRTLEYNPWMAMIDYNRSPSHTPALHLHLLHTATRTWWVNAKVCKH